MSQPNSKYQPGYLRIITTTEGVQLPAFPDGTRINRVVKTVVSQDEKQCRLGEASISVRMLCTIPESRFQNEEYCQFNKGRLVFKNQSVYVTPFVSLSAPEDASDFPENNFPYTLEFTVTAYPDPTIAHHETTSQGPHP